MAVTTAQVATALHEEGGLSRVKALYLAWAMLRKIEAWTVVRKLDIDDLELTFVVPIEDGISVSFLCGDEAFTVSVPVPRETRH